jgi:hypothetical protein
MAGHIPSAKRPHCPLPTARLLNLLVSRDDKSFQQENKNIIVEIARPLWKSLVSSRLVSSCIKDLVGLFSQLVKEECSLVLQAISDGISNFDSFRQILARLNELLSCEYTSVKCSVVRAIGSIATQLASFCLSSDTEMHESRSKMVDCFCLIIESIYDLYFQHIILSDEFSNDPVMATFMEECLQTWRTLAKVSGEILVGSNGTRSNLETLLLLRYFDVYRQSGTEQKHIETTQLAALTKASYGHFLQIRLDLANVASSFIVEDTTSSKETRHDMLELCLCSSLESPFTSQCEAACFLFQALSNRLEKTSPDLNPLKSVLQNCQELLSRMAEATPFCIVVESSNVLVSNPGLSRVLFNSLVLN